MKDNKMLKDKGITLIALVVTIIILLILVGVTISQITGENGLIRKAKETVERYKNASEEELIQLGELEQYVSDFSVVGGNEGEEKALVSIKENGLEVTGNVKEQTITVKVIVIGEASKIEYSIDNGTTWVSSDGEEVETKVLKEGTEEKETEYTYTFKELELGKSYFVRIKIYDVNGKNIEIISRIVTLSYVMTAEDEDVLEQETYLTEDGSLRTGTMPNKGAVNETLNAGGSYTIPEGYHNGKGTVKVSELSSQTSGDAQAGDILKGKKAWVNGQLVTGTMEKNMELGSSKRVIYNGSQNSSAGTIDKDQSYTVTEVGLIAYDCYSANGDGCWTEAYLNGTLINRNTGWLNGIDGIVKVKSGDILRLRAHGHQGSTSSSTAYISATFYSLI